MFMAMFVCRKRQELFLAVELLSLWKKKEREEDAKGQRKEVKAFKETGGTGKAEEVERK